MDPGRFLMVDVRSNTSRVLIFVKMEIGEWKLFKPLGTTKGTILSRDAAAEEEENKAKE